MGAFIDMAGKRVGRLHVLKRVGLSSDRKKILWLCRCICGTHVKVPSEKLRGPHRTRSCGCLQREAAARTGIRLTKHGHAGGGRTTVEYRAWNGLLGRCRNPLDRAYASYGGRGITVCARWEKFENFLRDMGPSPGRGYSIDRKNNDKGYYKRNCQWATRIEQARNRRSSRYVTFRGKRLTKTEWASCLGISKTTLGERLKRGWPLAVALTRPGDQGVPWKRAA